MSFANPGAATSTFGVLFVGGAGVAENLQMQSNVFADFISEASIQADSIIGGGFTLTANGASTSLTAFDNVLLVFSGAGTISMTTPHFRNYATSATQITINHPFNTTATIAAPTFLTTPTTGRVIVVNQTSGTTPVLATTITSPVGISGPQMLANPSWYSKSGTAAPTLTWGGTTL